MSKKLTEKSLEKKLHNMGTEELIQIIMSLYRSNKSVEQSINLQIIGDAYGNELLEKYKKRIYKIFNPSDIVRMGFSVDTAQQVLAEFADICVIMESGMEIWHYILRNVQLILHWVTEISMKIFTKYLEMLIMMQ